METSHWIVFIVCGSAFLAMACIVGHILGPLTRLHLIHKGKTGIPGQGGLKERFMRNGVSWTKPLMAFLLKNKHMDMFFDHMCTAIVSDKHASTSLNIASLYGSGVIVFFIIASMVGCSVLFGFLAAVCVIVVSFMTVSHMREAHDDALRNAIPDALRSMSVCSFAGLSLPQTFNQVSRETQEPLKSLFLHAVHDLEAGRTAAEALASFRRDARISELAFIAVALDVQHKTGGGMQQILDTACDTVESELELRRSLKVQTAQAKLSARIVSAMPFVLVTVFSFVSPDFLAPFFSSFMGYVLLGVAVLMQGAGILIVRSMLSVRG